jgi:hypothetical protein
MPSTPPEPPQGTTGVVHIVRDGPSNGRSPSSFLVSFGGKKDRVGAFSLGRASGLDPLAALLQKIGVLPADVETALQVLAGQPHHEIADVTLTQATIRELGL